MTTPSLLLDPNARAPDLSTQKAIPTTSLGPTSLFSSSAMPVISQAATQAKTSATTALNAPPTPPKLTDGITKTDSGTYQLVHNGQIVGTYATQQQAANAGDVLGGTGTPAPTPTPTPTPTNLPAGYTAGTPDASGNTTYSNSTTGHSLTVPAGAPASSLSSAASVQAALSTNSNYQGYQTSVDPTGYINVNDSSGKTAFQIDPTTAADSTAVGSILDEHGALLSTTQAANNTMQADLAALDAQHTQNLQLLEQEKSTAEESVRASYGTGVGSTDNTSGATTHFDQLIQQENDTYNANKLAIQSQNQTVIAAANKSFADSMTSISQTAQSTEISTTQQSKTNIQNTASSQNLLGVTLPNGATWQSVQNNPSSILNAQGLTRH